MEKNHLKKIINLPIKLFKIAVQNIIVIKITKYLSNILTVFEFNIDINVLSLLAILLLITCVYFIIKTVLSLFKNKDKSSSSSSSHKSDTSDKSCKYSSSGSSNICSNVTISC